MRHNNRVTVFDSLRLQNIKMRLSREVEPALDRAQYLAVATGRIEPYLRELSTIQVYLPLPAEYDQADGICFYHVYTTELRAQYYRGRDQGSVPQVQHLNAEDIGHALNCEDSQQIGLLIDPHLPSELTLEPRQLHQIAELRQGHPIPAALSPVAWESLRPLKFETADIPGAVRELIGQQLAEVAQVELIGHGGHTWWVVRFFDGGGELLDTPAGSAEQTPWLATIRGREPSWLEQEMASIPFKTI